MRSFPSVVAALVLASAAVAHGEAVQFTVQPGGSTVTINGTVASGPLSQQTPGSMTTSYTGMLNADLTGNVLTFTGGSTLDANPQAVAQQPGVDGLPGSTSADYGFSASLGAFGTAFVAARGVTLDVTSGPLTVGDGVVTGAANFAFINADIDYSAAITFGREELDGTSGDNAAVGTTLITLGNVQTLTIPLSVLYTASLISNGDTTLNATGFIVATRTLVPEPTLLSTAALAGAALLRRRRA